MISISGTRIPYHQVITCSRIHDSGGR